MTAFTGQLGAGQWQAGSTLLVTGRVCTWIITSALGLLNLLSKGSMFHFDAQKKFKSPVCPLARAYCLLLHSFQSFAFVKTVELLPPGFQCDPVERCETAAVSTAG